MVNGQKNGGFSLRWTAVVDICRNMDLDLDLDPDLDHDAVSKEGGFKEKQ